jgi:hypothetical protein
MEERLAQHGIISRTGGGRGGGGGGRGHAPRIFWALGLENAKTLSFDELLVALNKISVSFTRKELMQTVTQAGLSQDMRFLPQDCETIFGFATGGEDPSPGKGLRGDFVGKGEGEGGRGGGMREMLRYAVVAQEQRSREQEKEVRDQGKEEGRDHGQGEVHSDLGPGAEMISVDPLVGAQGMFDTRHAVVSGAIKRFLELECDILADACSGSTAAIAAIAELRSSRRGCTLSEVGRPVTHVMVLVTGQVMVTAAPTQKAREHGGGGGEGEGEGGQSASGKPTDGGASAPVHSEGAGKKREGRRRRTEAKEACGVAVGIISDGELVGWDGRLGEEDLKALQASMFAYVLKSLCFYISPL